MNTLKKMALSILAVAGSPGLLGAMDLQPATLQAWNAYIRTADVRMQARADGRQPYLWIDELPARRARVLRGEVVVAPMAERGSHSVPGGLIHDWIGAIFIPHATIAGLFGVVHDYNRYKDYFAPVVAESKAISRTGTEQEFSMIWQHRILVVNAAVQGRYQARDVMIDERRGYNIAGTAEMREIEEYGRAGQHLLPPDTGNGFIWRMHSIARYEERDGGVYLEIEATALTRDIPLSLRFMVNPVVNRLSVNSLTTTLQQTLDAVRSLPAAPMISAELPAGGR